MPERALVLPAPARLRHRRNPMRQLALDVMARLGSGVTLAALLVTAGAAAGLVDGDTGPAAAGTHVVTFEIAGHR